jgi:hypothetical protein
VGFCDGAAVLKVGEAEMVPVGGAAAHFVVEDMDAGGSRNVLEQLYTLIVVRCLDSFFVGEVLFAALVPDVLEAMSIESVFFLIASDIGNGYVVGVVRPLVCDSAFTDEDWCWWRAVAWVGPVV